jgi:hypothetical protein
VNAESSSGGIRISPKYYQKDWSSLSLEKRDSPDWDMAINIFKDRMEGRFLKHIDLLDNNPDRKIGAFAGFVTMALDCLLIETLEQFYKGKVRTGQGMDAKAFFDFFQRSPKFKTFFNALAKSEVFYNQIRCGLLHQAQTKKKSTIHTRPESILCWVDPDCIEEGIHIQRRLFHAEVVSIYNSYVEQLKDIHHLNLKRKFRRKMNFIANQK